MIGSHAVEQVSDASSHSAIGRDGVVSRLASTELPARVRIHTQCCEDVPSVAAGDAFFLGRPFKASDVENDLIDEMPNWLCLGVPKRDHLDVFEEFTIRLEVVRRVRLPADAGFDERERTTDRPIVLAILKY